MPFGVPLESNEFLVFLWYSFGIPLAFLWHSLWYSKGILGIRWIPMVPQKACIISRDHLEFLWGSFGIPLAPLGDPLESQRIP